MPIISSTKAGEAEQTDDRIIEQTRSCTAEGEPGEEDGWMKLEDIVQQEDNMAKKFCDKKC